MIAKAQRKHIPFFICVNNLKHIPLFFTSWSALLYSKEDPSTQESRTERRRPSIAACPAIRRAAVASEGQDATTTRNGELKDLLDSQNAMNRNQGSRIQEKRRRRRKQGSRVSRQGRSEWSGQTSCLHFARVVFHIPRLCSGCCVLLPLLKSPPAQYLSEQQSFCASPFPRSPLARPILQVVPSRVCRRCHVPSPYPPSN